MRIPPLSATQLRTWYGRDHEVHLETAPMIVITVLAAQPLDVVTEVTQTGVIIHVSVNKTFRYLFSLSKLTSLVT